VADLAWLAGLVAAVTALVVLFRTLRSLSGASVLVDMEGGELRVRRGQVPGLLLGELSEIARGPARPSGRVEWSGMGSTLEVATTGLDDSSAQRVQNVVRLHLGRR